MDHDEIACPQCAETIKAAAKVCRFCGHKLGVHTQSPAPAPKAPLEPLPFYRQWWSFPVAMVIMAAAGTGIFMLSTSHGEQMMRTDNPALEEVAKAFITKDLLDPSSAQFREISSGQNCVTGELNAKNRLGGYIGFVDFYYDAKRQTGRVRRPRPDYSNPSLIPADSDDIFDASDFGDEVSACINGTPVPPKFRPKT